MKTARHGRCGFHFKRANDLLAVKEALPHGQFVDLYADGDRWTTDPVRGAEVLAEGWLLPGLVDAHTHPGAEAPGDPLDEQVLRGQLRLHVRARPGTRLEETEKIYASVQTAIRKIIPADEIAAAI